MGRFADLEHPLDEVSYWYSEDVRQYVVVGRYRYDVASVCIPMEKCLASPHGTAPLLLAAIDELCFILIPRIPADKPWHWDGHA